MSTSSCTLDSSTFKRASRSTAIYSAAMWIILRVFFYVPVCIEVCVTRLAPGHKTAKSSRSHAASHGGRRLILIRGRARPKLDAGFPPTRPPGGFARRWLLKLCARGDSGYISQPHGGEGRWVPPLKCDQA